MGQIPETRTDAHGRFTLDDVLEDVPIRVIVNAFGYLPVDTILLPGEHQSYLFEPVVDPVLERMIEVQVGRIEERSDGYFTGGMRPIARIVCSGTPVATLSATRSNSSME